MLLFKTTKKDVKQFKNIEKYVDGYAVAKLDNARYVYINEKKEIVSREFLYAQSFSGGMAVVRISDDSSYYFIDRDFSIASNTYEYIVNTYKDGYAIVCILFPDVEGYLMRDGAYFGAEKRDVVKAMSQLICDFEINDKNRKNLFNDINMLKSADFECQYRLKNLHNVDFGYDDKEQAKENLSAIKSMLDRAIKDKTEIDHLEKQ